MDRGCQASLGSPQSHKVETGKGAPGQVCVGVELRNMLQPRGWGFRDDENSAVYRTDVGNEPPRECVNLVWCREAGGSQVTHNRAGPILLGWDTDCSAKEPLLPFMLGVSSKLRIPAFHMKDYFRLRLPFSGGSLRHP